MITVEELIIQSLYHRMVVVNVRRTPTVAPTGGRVDALGLLISGAQRMRGAMQAQGSIQGSSNQGQIQGQSQNQGSLTHNSVSPSVASSGAECVNAGVEEEGSVMQVKSCQGTVDFSEEVQTILDTGEIKLVKAIQKTTETQTDFSPVWFFGFDPTANQPPATVTTPDGTIVPAEVPEVKNIPAVDLSRFDQFSVVHYSDTRDPENRKMVMIQTPGSKMYTPEQLCSENLAIHNRTPSLDIPKHDRRHFFDRKSKSLDNGSSISQRNHNQIQENRGHENILKRQERVFAMKPESGDEASHEGDLSVHDPDIDSGIWDMVHGRDTRLSSREVASPNFSPNISKDISHREHEGEGDAGRDEVKGAEGGVEKDEQSVLPEDEGASWQEMYEQMGMGLLDGDRPTMSYRVFHIQDQNALDSSTANEEHRLESSSDRSASPLPVDASTPQAKTQTNREEVSTKEERCSLQNDHDSDFETDLRSSQSTTEESFTDDVFPMNSIESVEDSGWLFDKIPAMQGSLIHSPSSPSSPSPFPQYPPDGQEEIMNVQSVDDITPTDTQPEQVSEIETIMVQNSVPLMTSSVSETEAKEQLAPSHPELPNRDSVESTETVTEESEDLMEHVEDHDVSKKETLCESTRDVCTIPPDDEEQEHELSMTESSMTMSDVPLAHSSGFDQALFDDQEEVIEAQLIGPVCLKEDQKMAEVSSPSSGTADEASVVEVSQATSVSNGEIYESCDEGPVDGGVVTIETVITETVTTETVTTTTTSTPESSRPGSAEPTRKATPVDAACRKKRPSPLQASTTPNPQLRSPRSKPTSPLARTFAAAASGSSTRRDESPERGCIVHRSGARPKLPSSAMSPKRGHTLGLQSLLSDEPGTLINGHTEHRGSGNKGPDNVYLLNRDGTLTNANAGVAHRSGTRPKSTSLSGVAGRSGDLGLQGLNSLMVRSTSSNVVHSHVITELTAARTRLNVPELRRTPDRHSVASSDSEYASVDSSLATSPTSTSVEELASVGSDTCLLAEVMPVANYQDWMGNLPKRLHAVPLTQLAIPGSNISLAIESEMRTDMSFSKCNLEMAEFLRKLPPLAVFDNFRKIMKDIWRAWMPKQILSVAKQLEAGVRYLDIHITRFRGTFYGEHGLYTRSLKHYLRHVDDFIQQHEKEIVLLHFQKLNNLTQKDKRSLVTLLFQFFGAKLCRVMDTENLTLEELWGGKKQIIVIFPDADMPALSNHIFAGLIWSNKVIRSSLPRKQTTEELMTYLECIYDEQRDPLEFHALQAVVSPDMNMVFGDYHHKSMRSLTLCETSPYLKVWLPGKENLNIVTVDFVGIYDLTGEIIRLNAEKKAVTAV